jgi:hypothetical protein
MFMLLVNVARQIERTAKRLIARLATAAKHPVKPVSDDWVDHANAPAVNSAMQITTNTTANRSVSRNESRTIGSPKLLKLLL